ncbi:pilus assembly protein CpaB [Glaciihabitans tibetensis]|uniref:Pilus assembly protein CpaB n=1 Tax=Glaciihabitans tibetensis TaxID=1266600 RepID=A0A2T0VBC4_9MICO|nr:Flp pilus assembly protein CpaB [Glaciihabitans tibetensis]PRY67506.1 pilus assembly protein CpaB [Glaciihabitans tibetensis]
MKIRLISALAALVLAIIGVVLLSQYVQGADERAYGEAQTVEVLVVAAAVPAGTPTEDLGEFLEVKAVPQSVVAEDVVTNLAQFGGRVVGVDLVVGETLLASRLIDPTALVAPGSIPAPEGLQEFTVTLTAEQTIGGRLAAGDTVGIYVSFGDLDPAEARILPGTNHVFHRVLVTSVQGVVVPSDDSSAAPVPEAGVFVTFATTAVDAERIIWARQYAASLWLSLETEDDLDADTKMVTDENFLQ